VSAQDEPRESGVVRVLSRTSLWIEVSADGTTLVGHLSDDLDHRLADRLVDIESPAMSTQVRTDRRGEISVALPNGAGIQRITATFRGDELHAGTTASRVIDPGRGAVRLQLFTPSEVMLDLPRVEVQVRAEHGDQPVEIPIVIALAESTDALGTARTDIGGWASVSIDTRALRPPGRRALDARFDGDARLAPAVAQAGLLVVDATRLSLVSDRRLVLPDEDVRLRGVLEGSMGAVGGEVVEVMAADQVLGTATTGPDGTFALRVAARSLPRGTRTAVRARYSSPVPWRRSCASAEVLVEVEDPAPVGWTRAIVPLAVTLLVLASVLWSATRRRKAQKSATPSSDQAAESGLRYSAVPSRAARRADRFDIGGRVIDPVLVGPVGSATVVAASGTDRRSETTSRDGSFSISRLEGGRYRVTVGAAGYLPESFVADVPHQGKLSQIEVAIVQVRHRALEVYKNVARDLLPRASLWNRWTPREVAVHAVRNRPSLADAMAELTSAFEEVYYSPRLSTIEDLEQIRDVASRIDELREARDDRRDGG
jgi:hypothetical protein